MPTGSGKSLVIASIAAQLDTKIVIFQPSKEILEQNFAKYQSYSSNPQGATIYSASFGSKQRGQVVFATIGSVYKNPQLFADYSYLIVDECHFVNP